MSLLSRAASPGEVLGASVLNCLGEEVTAQRQHPSRTAVLLKPSAMLQGEPGCADGEEVYRALPNVWSRRLAQAVPEQRMVEE